MEKISNEYDAVVSCLADRAILIKSDNKTWSMDECIRQAIDDGFFYTDDRAYVLAWSLANGIIEWGKEICWEDVEQNLIDDIANEILKGEM